MAFVLIIGSSGCTAAVADVPAIASPMSSTADAPSNDAAGDDGSGGARDQFVQDGDLHPGMVRGKVLTDSGQMVTAGIIIEDENGNRWRTVTNPLSGFNLRLQPGTYTLTFTRGPEYTTVTKEVWVESYKVNYMQDIRLVQMFDTYSRGWIAGDLHMHTFYSDGADSVDEQLYSNISTGLYFGFLTDHNTARGLSEWVQGNRVVANIDSEGNERPFFAFEGLEVTTEFGHYQSLGVGLAFDTYEVLLREIERSKKGEELDEIIKNKIIYIAETIRREGGVPQINHPFSSNTMGFNYWEIAHYFDTIEIWNGVFVPGDGRYESDNPSMQEQNYRSKMKWYELLNEVKNGGKYFAATGGTDNHETASAYRPQMELGDTITSMEEYNELYRRNDKYSGVPTTFVYCPDEINQENVLEALRNGNSFISNGIIVLADVDGISYGNTAEIGEEGVTLNIEAYCPHGFEGIQIIKNGEVMKEITLDKSTTLYDESVTLEGISADDWIVLEVFGVETYYAITNPIFFA